MAIENPNGPEVIQVLERVALSERSAVALNTVMVTQDLRQVDAVNRALQTYEYVSRNPVYVKRRLGGILGWLGFAVFVEMDFTK